MAVASPRRSPQPRASAPSSLTIRNVVVAGRRTSVRLEPSMWDGLRDIARRREMSLNDLVSEIDGERDGLSLTAAIRVHVVDFYRNAATGGVERETVRLPS